MRRLACLGLALLALAALTVSVGAQSKEPIKIGLAAAVSGGSAASGEAIKRGMQIDMDEVNAKGGLLGGRKLEDVQAGREERLAFLRMVDAAAMLEELMADA